ncbi:MAG: Eco57I restriction-modification methylase domain-containing protein, partial [Thermoguttaceae bacterium]
TDFEEFAVYDTRIKPHKDDKASTARIFYCKYDEYLDKFDFLIDTFSKEAILRGSFDRYVQSKKNKRGTSEVDDEILALVEEWRLTLAKNIAKQNPSLDSHLLNVAVQRIVDRILFLRIAEDRRIEEYEALLAVARKGDIYSGLQRLFGFADEKYNAGLFKHEAWLEKIRIDDKVLKPIIAGLYYPESPYEFSVLPIEILGSIYERFLGKTIVLSPSHVAKVEEKPEVRKAGGVYYTPQYIVDYIIAETVGEKFDVNRNVTVLDPACGSGSFLVGAYTFLLNSHLAFYTSEKNLKKSLKSGLIYESRHETYLLSIEEKQRILLASIFGVDIDPIAVEVTKLSLYLKLLENETDESAGLLLRHSTLKMLPNLDANIRCGNSLIGSDFYLDKEMPLFGDNEIRRINAFDWHKEFPAIFKSGGFDCVIGNPPWGQKAAKFSDDEKAYYAGKFPAASVGIPDLSRFLSSSRFTC